LRVSRPARIEVEAQSEGLGGDHRLTPTDARRPARQVVGDDLDGHPGGVSGKTARWQVGVAYGLGVYPGDRGLLNYLTTMTWEDEPYGVEALERGLALSAVLVPMTRALDPMMDVKDDASY